MAVRHERGGSHGPGNALAVEVRRGPAETPPRYIDSKEPDWLDGPPVLKAKYRAFEREVACQYPDHSLVSRLSWHGAPRLFPKLSRAGHQPTPSGEALRMRWARAYLPVPEVVDQGTEDPVAWFCDTTLAYEHAAPQPGFAAAAPGREKRSRSTCTSSPPVGMLPPRGEPRSLERLDRK